MPQYGAKNMGVIISFSSGCDSESRSNSQATGDGGSNTRVKIIIVVIVGVGGAFVLCAIIARCVVLGVVSKLYYINKNFQIPSRN